MAKRKARMEKLIAGGTTREEKKYKQTIRLMIKKRIAKDEAEVLADCEVMKAYYDNKVSEQAFNETFIGNKAGFYKNWLKGIVCYAEQAEKSETQVLYDKKAYEYVNAASIMTVDNKCNREHLR